MAFRNLLSEQAIEVPRPVCQDGRIQDLTAASAFPGVKRPDEIVVFLGEHSPFAFWTFHKYYLPPRVD
jgi:hypothetical protein